MAEGCGIGRQEAFQGIGKFEQVHTDSIGHMTEDRRRAIGVDGDDGLHVVTYLDSAAPYLVYTTEGRNFVRRCTKRA